MLGAAGYLASLTNHDALEAGAVPLELCHGGSGGPCHWWRRNPLVCHVCVGLGPASQLVLALCFQPWLNILAKDHRGKSLRSCGATVLPEVTRTSPGSQLCWLGSLTANICRHSLWTVAEALMTSSQGLRWRQASLFSAASTCAVPNSLNLSLTRSRTHLLSHALIGGARVDALCLWSMANVLKQLPSRFGTERPAPNALNPPFEAPRPERFHARYHEIELVISRLRVPGGSSVVGSGTICGILLICCLVYLYMDTCLCMFICEHYFQYLCIYIYIYTHAYIYIYVCMYVCTQVYICIHIYIRMVTYTHSLYTYVHIDVSVSVS